VAKCGDGPQGRDGTKYEQANLGVSLKGRVPYGCLLGSQKSQVIEEMLMIFFCLVSFHLLPLHPRHFEKPLKAPRRAMQASIALSGCPRQFVAQAHA